MNKEEEAFKRSLRKLFDADEYAFSESAWEKQLKIIARHEKRKHRKIFFLTGSGLLSLGLGLLYYFHGTLSVNGGENNLARQAAAIPASTSTGMTGASTPETSSGQVPLSMTGTSASRAAHFNPSKSSGLNMTKETQNDKDPEHNVAESRDSKNKTSVHSHSTLIAPSVPRSFDPAEDSEINDQGSGLSVTKHSDRRSGRSFNKQPAAKILNTKKENYSDKTITTDKQIPNTGIEPGIAASLPDEEIWEYNWLRPIEYFPELVQLAEMEVRKVKPDTFPLPDLLYKYSSHSLDIEAGTAYSMGWKNLGKSEASGFNPLLGLRYSYAFGKRYAASIGLQYTSLSGPKFDSYVSENIDPDFGAHANVKVYTPLRIHYLVLPVKCYYHLSTLHSLSFGLNLAYLLTVKSDVQSYSRNAFGTEGPSHSTAYGFTQGFEDFDAQICMGYHTQLYRCFSSGIELFYGLMDVKQNSFFPASHFERNSGIKLSISATLFKKQKK